MYSKNSIPRSFFIPNHDTMKILLTLIAFFSFSLSVKSQETQKYEYFIKNNVKVISPTYLNLVGMALTDEKNFISTMKNYGYEVVYNYSEGFYEATTWASKTLYSIKKIGYEVYMMFTPDSEQFVQKIITDLNQKGVTYTLVNGTRRYNVMANLAGKYQCNFTLDATTGLEGNTTLLYVRVKKSGN